MTESPFAPSALQRHVDTALAGLPPTHQHALVAYARPDGTIGLSVATRAGQTWTAGASLTYDLTHQHVSGGLTIRGSW